MKKAPYITVLTALAMLFLLYNSVHLNLLLLIPLWLVELAVLLGGEMIGTRVGKDFRYAPNIGAAVSSALILTLYILWVISIKHFYPERPTTDLYDIIGAVAVRSLLINLGSAAAKRVLVWREHHGALPPDNLSLRGFLPHFIVTAVLSVLNTAVFYVMWLLFTDFLFYEPYGFIPLAALQIATYAELANMIGIFADRLLEKRLINNALICVVGIVRIIIRARYIFRALDPEFFFTSAQELTAARFEIIAWGALIAAAVVWAAVKHRKRPIKSENRQSAEL